MMSKIKPRFFGFILFILTVAIIVWIVLYLILSTILLLFWGEVRV